MLSRRPLHVALWVGLFSALQASAGTPFYVSGLSPGPGSPSVPRSMPITVAFSETVNSNTLTPDTFRVWGNQAGFYGGTLTGSPVMFDPDTDFRPGERITVILTSNILSDSAVTLEPFQFEFTARADGCFNFELFEAAGNLFATNNDYEAALGDLDGDGDLDLFMASDQGDLVFTNDGNGIFTHHQLLVASQGRRVALGDVDSDGDLDVFVAVTVLSESLIYSNNGSATFTTNPIPGSGLAYGGALGDLNGDGHLDILLGILASPDLVFTNDGRGSFTLDQQLGHSWAYGMELGDLDGDGDLDAFAVNTVAGGTNLIYMNDGTGRFTTNTGPGTGLMFDAAIGDLDGDGDLDIYVGNNAGGDLVYSNDGSGVFTVSQMVGSEDTRGVCLADLDADGDLDALTGCGNDGVRVFRNDGACTFSAAAPLDSGYARSVTTGDIDGDGDVDVVVPVTLGSSPPVIESSSVWLNMHCNDSGDFDMDGIPNYVEVEVASLSPTNAADAYSDADLDTQTAIEEYIAGTIITNGESFFRVKNIFYNTGPLRPTLQVDIVSGRIYEFGANLDPLDPSGWQVLLVYTSNASGTLSIVDTSSTPLLHLRARVRMNQP